MLLFYPREFRRDFGPDMAQVFQDCYRSEQRSRGPGGIWSLWFQTFLDLARTAPKEHLEKLGKDDSVMNNFRRDALALLGCIAIIVVAFLLLSYGRRHEVPAILIIGRALDALVTAGIVGNLIVFLLAKLTKFNPVRIALWTFLVVHGGLLLIAALIGSRVDPQFSLTGVLIAYVVSFIFWFALHWIWAKSKGSAELALNSGE
jgi:hypothetical protein